jgi:hypothetical protein
VVGAVGDARGAAGDHLLRSLRGQRRVLSSRAGPRATASAR